MNDMNEYINIIQNNEDLRDSLREDILNRYDNEEYWDKDIIEDWISDNDDKLKHIQRGEQI